MAAELKGTGVTYDYTFTTATISANTWYRVAGDYVIHNSIEYYHNNIFYSGAITTITYPFDAIVNLTAVFQGVSLTYDTRVYYFAEGDGGRTTQLTDDVSLPRLADYEVEMNFANSALLQTLSGQAAGTSLTYDELVTLVGANPNVSATIDGVNKLLNNLITSA